MKRGATESYKFNFNNVNVSDMAAIRVIFSQGKVKLIKSESHMHIDTEKNFISVSLSQEDTYMFSDKAQVQIQLKFKDTTENVDLTKVFTEAVFPALDDEII